MDEKITQPAESDRTLHLLWRHELGEPAGARGPKQTSSVDDVVHCGIELADAGGLDSFSMRKIADRLGLGAMSVYTYVPGKAELLALMVDQVMAERPLHGQGGELRERLEGLAAQLWEEYLAHPWLLQIHGTRPALGPNLSRRYEQQLAAVEGIGLDDVEMDQVVTLIAVFVGGAARAVFDAQTMLEKSGMSDEEWWRINAPILTRVMDGSRFPISGRVGTTVGELYGLGDPHLAFRFGLARVLDGIESYVASKGSGADRLAGYGAEHEPR